ncbi:MAG: hypothetical protein EWM73_02760 [Nitrospira sp.]|nr:MAG: hypothetical protein EWM73_02760 [Nitrospira sp.]
MNKSVTAAMLAATLIMFQPVWAHTDESLDAMPSPHGGQVRAAGPYHLELVAKDGELVVHVTDHAWKELKTEGGEGKANIQQAKAGSKITVKLEPSQQNMLTGNGEFHITPETVIVVFVKLPEQEAYGARFTPLKPKSVGAGKKSAEGHDHDLQHHHN